MIIEEAAFSLVDGSTISDYGKLSMIVTSDMVKSKWVEILYSGLDLGITHIHKTHHMYNEIRNCYPGAVQSVGRDGIFLTQRELSYFYWVVKGNISREVFNILKEAWSFSLYKKYLEALQDSAIVQFYDEYFSNIDGLRHAIGKDSRKDADLIDTWIWGSGDKRCLFITQVKKFRSVVNNAHAIKVDFTKFTSLGISEKTQQELFDSKVIVEPRRNKQLSDTALLIEEL